jgi:hypothetical protein
MIWGRDWRRPVTAVGHVTPVPCSCCRRSPPGLSGRLRISLPLRSPPPGAAERRGRSCNRAPSPSAPTPPAAAEARSRNRSSATSSSLPPSTPLASGTRSHAAQVSHMHRVFWLAWVNDCVGVVLLIGSRIGGLLLPLCPAWICLGLQLVSFSARPNPTNSMFQGPIYPFWSHYPTRSFLFVSDLTFAEKFVGSYIICVHDDVLQCLILCSHMITLVLPVLVASCMAICFPN